MNNTISELVEKQSKYIDTLYETALRNELKLCYGEQEWHGVRVNELGNGDIEQFIIEQDLRLERTGGEFKMGEAVDCDGVYTVKAEITPISIKIYKRVEHL